MLNFSIKQIIAKLPRVSLLYSFFLLVLASLWFNIYLIYNDFFGEKINFTIIYFTIFVVAILVITFGASFIRSQLSWLKIMKKDRHLHFSKLRRRIIIAFSLGASLPTILVAIFSTYFFNFGVEAWFDQKISKVLEQSVKVGKSYISEHELQLRETAISVADDLNAMYYDLTHSPNLFSQIINAQAEMRSLDEAVVFQKTNNVILAQTKLSFSLSFINIPLYLIERASKGEVVQISTDPNKIRSLIKLKDYHDTYLLIGRLVDTKILDHINQTDGTAAEYFRLKNHISSIQIKFSAIFILLSLVLLSAAIIRGRNFAEEIVRPIRELVIAAEKVKNGDLSVQVPIKKLRRDEIRVLSTAFNRMVSQIDNQRKELVIAERALAWSDVARKVAHEIKNPLTPIQLSAEMILKKYKKEVKDQASFEKYLRNILKHSRDIRDIVSEFVEFARLPSPDFTKYEIISLINDLIESRILINSDISYYFTSSEPEYEFICDISQLNRVFVNLLLNAEEAFPKKQKNKAINIALQVIKGKLQIIFTDNGCGFQKDLLIAAKDAYVTTKAKGTGLGLSIVNRIIVDHSGILTIANNQHGGARIELVFDLEELKRRANGVSV